MTFLHKEYFVIIVIGIVFFTYLILKNNKKFFTWVEDHWFFKRSFNHKLSTFFYIAGLSLLSFALMDLRGPEEHIVGKVSDQKTIILVDSSASMLAEDVRPNRFKKALLLVKHYVKKAVGQKIALIVFSDGQKKIVPFTDDYNLIDARIDTLKGLNLTRGGTGLTQAIQESIQYFRNSSGEVNGNILIFTDAEETDGGLSLDIPDGISVGIVGIGTSKGAPIPVRNTKGVFKGNKKFKGKVVISKLDDKFLKGLGQKIKNYKFWIATSYSLPTEEIISFFTNIKDLKDSKNDFRVRPVLATYLMIPGVIFLGLSFLFGRRKVFIMMSLLIFSFSIFARDLVDLKGIGAEGEKEEKEPVKSTRTIEMEESFIKGTLPIEGKKALASSLLKDNFPDDSAALYNELLNSKISNQNKSDHFNQATAMLKSKQQAGAINKYNELLKYLEQNESDENNKIADLAKKNILKALQAGGKGTGESKEDQESEDGQKDDSDGEGKDQDKPSKSDSKKKDGKEGKEGKDKDNKDKKDENKDKDGKDKKKNKKESKSESNNEKKKRKKKLPALLKQLMSDDNQLQKKMIDAKTTERKSRDRKDW